MRTLPILTLHSIDESGSVISVSRAAFRALMGQLADSGWRGYDISTALSRWRQGDGRCFAISFDDGYASVRDHGLPALRDLGFTATVFVVAGRAGQSNRWPGQPDRIAAMPLLDWNDLATLRAEGWEVGSHGLEHRCLTALATGDAERQVAEAQTLIATNLGEPVPLFAYPYGAHDRIVRDLVGRYHELAFGTRLALATAAEFERRFAVSRVDAYYLRRFHAPTTLQTRRGGAYLALRRWGRALRRVSGAAVG